MKNNVHPTQIKQRKKLSSKPRFSRNVENSVSSEYYGNLSNTIAPPVFVNSIWEQIRLGNETPETIAAIKEKASRVGPAFNKGGNQLLSKDQIIYSGKK